jgi:anti-sigma factor RsiW
MTPLDRHLSDDQAQRLVDGALSEAEAPALERHVAACADCQASVATYRMLTAALDDLDVPELPADFTDGVLARIDAQEQRLARERKHAAAILLGVLAATAAAFVVAGAAAWAPVVSSAFGALGSLAQAFRIGAGFVPDVFGALRFQIILATGVLALPLLLALSRLMPSPRAETV